MEPCGWIETRKIDVVAPGGSRLLSDISLAIPKGAFVAVIGLSGCGKSTLIRTLAGLLSPQAGEVRFAGHPVGEIKKQYPLALGYIPQFGTFHAELTVREILEYAVSLRLPPSVDHSTRTNWLGHVVALAGIESILGQTFSTLSGGQMRRVALAEELVGDPAFLLLDELTTGLDVFSDGEIMRWLRDLAHQHGKTVLLVTHGTQHIGLCDRVIFLHQGRLVHFGTEESLLHSNDVKSIEELFGKFSIPIPEIASEAPPPSVPCEPEALQTDRPPNGLRQFPALLRRQMTLLIRDKGQLALQAVLIITFPLLVAVFALNGLPQVRSIADEAAGNILRTLEQKILFLQNAFEAASLVSGLIMFQVILLTLIGANNGAREIAREREIIRKELFAGLSPTASVATKFLQLLIFSFLQASWMAWFVKTACGFPGSLFEQFLILFLTTLAMSVTCLAISAASPSAERASLLSIYLVGFQLPLSGAALALPDWLSGVCRPFVAAYWGWSGYLRTLDGSRYFRLVSDSTQTNVADYSVAVFVLSLHILFGLMASIYFVNRLQKVTR
ncbi:MAG: ATP-binding cassette domain-containing protein [Terrimicrobiaceae bacterium]